MTTPGPASRPTQPARQATRQPTRTVSKTFSHTAAPDDLRPGGVSFLRLLLNRFPYHTEAEWRARIRDGRVTLDGEAADPEAPVARGARLEYRVEGYEEPAVPIDFHEVCAAGDLTLVHKPAGLPVHKTGKVFVNVLANLYREFRDDDAWTPLNRLDVETSGIVAFARGREALRRFSPEAAGTRWTKTYLAVVTIPQEPETPDGQPESRPSPSELSFPERHEGPLAEWPEHPIRSRMRVHAGGKPATTLFRRLAVAGGKALILVRTVTGRKHQIRAHLADLGFPIVGDKVYAHDGRYYLKRLEGELESDDLAVLESPHQLLHAVQLEIRDALGEGIRGMDLDLPEGFRRFFPVATPEYLAARLSRDFFG